jgi:cytoskeletal protein RodZ
MKTVGEILRNTRLQQNLTIEDISVKTKIQTPYLEALEKDNFKVLPTLTFVKGFIQNYAKALGINPQTALAVFRRDFAPDATGRIVPKSLVTPIAPHLTISPKTVTTAAIASMILFLVIIFARQIVIFYRGPEINLDTPSVNQQVTSPIRVSGHTQNSVTLSVNQQSIPVSADGSFITEIQLSPGEHVITVTAVSQDGKSTTSQQPVTVLP